MTNFTIQTDFHLLRLGGQDRLDFLQRQSTNDLRHVAPGHAIATVLTTPAARILDVLVVFSLDDETLGIIPLLGKNDHTLTYLKSRIFFMDRVTLEAAPSPWGQITFPGAAVIPQEIAAHLEGANCAPLAHGGWHFAPQGNAFPAPTLIVPQGSLPAWQARLTQHGHTPWDAPAWTRWRLEQGIPGAAEWHTAYTPLEVGLESLIAANKGCYTGQEIIARQRAYGKITRHLCRLEAHTPFASDAPIFTARKQRVGEVTSAIRLADGRCIGLGVLRKPHPEAQETLFAQDVPITASVSPFLTV
ncbi:MAG: glycine cleavage T C-terminal barrel domain-containing protein [Anaerolineales bacterium]